MFYCCCCHQAFKTVQEVETHALASATKKYGTMDECGHHIFCYGCFRKFKLYERYIQHLTKPPSKQPCDQDMIETCVRWLNGLKL